MEGDPAQVAGNLNVKTCALCGRPLSSIALVTVAGEKVEVCYDANGCRRTVLESRLRHNVGGAE
jgi:ribosome-binding protein aMBF1 (putative translation factor)